jgi:tetratricopeptide (TPR) repeat protein
VAVLVHARPRHRGPPLAAASARRCPGRTVRGGRQGALRRGIPRRRAGENEEALSLLEASLGWAKEVGATAAAAFAAADLCAIRAEARSSTSERRAALGVGEEAVALARAAGGDFVLAIALNNLGVVTRLLGENERATAYFEESLELRRRIGDLSRIALSLCNVAEKALLEGKTDKAASMYAEAVEIATAIGDKRHVLVALGGLGRVAYREERWEEAGTHARESLRIAQELGMKQPAVDDIFCLAGIATATGDTTRAARLAAAAVHLSLSCSPRGRRSQRSGDRRAREGRLRPGNMGASLGGGSAMSLDEAAEYALSSA